jgi:S-adenosylmethionine/arginine decarboxylase-like enzyme
MNGYTICVGSADSLSQELFPRFLVPTVNLFDGILTPVQIDSEEPTFFIQIEEGSMSAGNGKHVKLHLYGARFEHLVDVNLAEKFLNEMIAAVNMRPLGPAHVYDIRKAIEAAGELPDPDEPEGVTGVMVLSTSHATIHTWPHRGYAVVDVYSCGDFVTGEAIAVIERIYNVNKITMYDLSYSLVMPLLDQRETENA